MGARHRYDDDRPDEMISGARREINELSVSALFRGPPSDRVVVAGCCNSQLPGPSPNGDNTTNHSIEFPRPKMWRRRQM